MVTYVTVTQLYDIIEECGRFWNNNIILHVDSM